MRSLPARGQRKHRHPSWRSLVVVSLLLLALVLGGCGESAEPTAQAGPFQSPLVADSPLPTATPAAAGPQPTPTWVPTLTPLPTATLLPTPAPGQLVVLHTNDNWGETEPCG